MGLFSVTWWLLRRKALSTSCTVMTRAVLPSIRSRHQVTLNSPTNSTDVIYHTARELMRQMWPDRPVRLVGVSAEKTGTDNFEQLDFFTDPAKTDKQEKLDRAADALRARFGEGAILRAKLLHPDEKTTAPKALGAAKTRDKRKGEL